MSRFLRPLYAVLRFDELSEKLADEGDAVTAKLRLWNEMKLAAANDAGGNALGLARIARDIYNTVKMSAPNAKTASADDALEACILAASFASAVAVDEAVEKKAAAGEISERDAVALQRINAVSALSDLNRIVKHAAPNWITPVGIGAAGGGVLGAGLGAWADPENRVRGAVMGGLGGAAVGSLGGALYHNLGDALRTEEQTASQQAAQQATSAERETQQHAWRVEDRARDAATRAETAAKPARDAAEAAAKAAQAAQAKHKNILVNLAAEATHHQNLSSQISRSPRMQQLLKTPAAALSPSQLTELNEFNKQLTHHGEMAKKHLDLATILDRHKDKVISSFASGADLPEEVRSFVTDPDLLKLINASSAAHNPKIR